MNDQQASFTITFRPMTLNDVTRVHEIDVLSFAMPWSERSYRFELTENQNAVAWVAERKNHDTVDVVGMIVVWSILDEAHIATIAIHPDYRGFGIGRRLLARALLAAHERGAQLAYLEVRRGNLKAQKLYNQFGFEVVGERPRYYKDNNEDALLMTMSPIDPQMLTSMYDRE